MNLCNFLIVFIGCLLNDVNSLTFHLPPNSRRCFKEIFPKRVIVQGEYKLSDAPGQQTGLLITDSKDNHLVVRKKVSEGRFAFRSCDDDADIYKICFDSKMLTGQTGMIRKVEIAIIMIPVK